MSDVKWVVLDTETTGPTPQDKICELAWIEVDAELNVIEAVSSLIDPEMPISPSASGVHGLTNEMLQDEPTIEEFFTHVRPDAFVAQTVVIGHNAVFDLRYVTPYIPGLAGSVCTLRLARRLWPEAENHKLSTLMYYLKLVKGTSHRAAGDAETTLDLLRKIVDKSGKGLPELAAESLKPIFVDVMPFGKHKGTPLKKLPYDYVQWLLKLDNLDRDMRYSLDLLQAGKA